MTKNAHQIAFGKWFQNMEVERRRQKLRPGRLPKDFPAPPPTPQDVTEAIHQIGVARALALLQVHRSTLDRWMAGDTSIPAPAWLALRLLSEGRIPGMSDDWRYFRVENDLLCIVGTRHTYSAAQILGFHYVETALEIATDKIKRLESQLIAATAQVDFGCANDSYGNPQDIRSKAFIR